MTEPEFMKNISEKPSLDAAYKEVDVSILIHIPAVLKT